MIRGPSSANWNHLLALEARESAVFTPGRLCTSSDQLSALEAREVSTSVWRFRQRWWNAYGDSSSMYYEAPVLTVPVSIRLESYRLFNI